MKTLTLLTAIGTLSLGILGCNSMVSEGVGSASGTGGGSSSSSTASGTGGSSNSSSSTSSVASSSSGAGGAASACVIPGEVSGTLSIVASIEMHPLDFAVAEDCSGINVVYEDYQSAADPTLYQCPYEGCNPNERAKLPKLSPFNGAFYVESIGQELFYSTPVYPQDPGNQTDFWGGAVHSTSLDLSSKPALLGQSTLYYAIRRLQRWGNGVVAHTSEKGAGANYKHQLVYFDGAANPTLTDGASSSHYVFSARDMTEAYGVRTTYTADTSAVFRWNLSGGNLSIAQGSIPKVAGDIVALPEALVIFRTTAQGGAFSTCDYSSATPCETETALPASLGTDITGPFEVAHGRLYASRTTKKSGASIVYCATTDIAQGTCTWTELGATGSQITKMAHDSEHIYALRESQAGSTLERIAK